MESHTVNVLLTSFPGLGLPPTLSLPIEASISITELRHHVLSRLPQIESRLILTTTSNREINDSDASLSSLLSCEKDTFLPIRLSVPLCGGKGGFGSQLRAAGGRMSSKRKNNQGDSNNSNRNLDGRRLRTVNEAKALAEYLALKPEMDKKEKEARRKRWQQVVDLSEKREFEIRNGTKGKVDGKWVEDKEEAGERAREAVQRAMKTGDVQDNLVMVPIHSPTYTSTETGEQNLGRISSDPNLNKDSPAQLLFGFGDDDEFMSDASEYENSKDAVGARCAY